MSKHIQSYCDNCDTQYNDYELCDCETEFVIEVENSTRSKRIKKVAISILVFMLGFASAIPVMQPLKNNINKTEMVWTKADSQAYAYDKLLDWQHKEYQCLVNLWNKESSWRPTAYNKVKVMGKNAGGIPQILGLDPKTPPTIQIERGLSYIYNRYGTPCKAWKHFQKKGWH
jgi:hypothetical protein